MKKSELKEYIKTQIREKLYAGPGSIAAAKTDSDYGKLKPIEKSEIEKTLRSGGSAELEEMARPASELRIAPDFREKAANIQTGGPVSPRKLEAILDIIDSMLERSDIVTGPQIAQAFGTRMDRIYPIISALQNVGALTTTSTSAEEETEDDEEMMGDNEVTDDETSSTETEFSNFDDNAEPEMGTLEKSQVTFDPVTQAATIFTLDNDNLIQSLIRTYKESRIRIGEIREEEGDLSASDYKKALKQGKEASLDILERKLEELISKIEKLDPEVQDKVLKSLDFKFKSVDATRLFNILAKKLGKTLEPNVPEEEKITDTDDELMEDSGVEDVDHDESSFKDYDSVYERMIKLVNYKG
jgi:hypothetical protein